MLSEVSNVSTEPHLQSLSGEALRLELQTLNLMLDLILLLMVSGVEDLNVPSLMLESSTLVHHLIVYLILLTAAMRRRGVSMSNACVRLSMAILLH